MALTWTPYYNADFNTSQNAAIDSNGNAWYTDGMNIWITDPNGTLLKKMTFNTPSMPGSNSNGLSQHWLIPDTLGNMYGAGYSGGNCWCKIAYDGTTTYFPGQTAPNYSNGRPTTCGIHGSDVYWASGAFLYSPGVFHGYLYKFSLLNQQTTQIGTTDRVFDGNVCDTLYCDSTNTIWVCDCYNGQIKVYSTAGALLTTISAGLPTLSSTGDWVGRHGAYDALTNRILLVGHATATTLVAIDPATYAVTDQSSVIVGYTPKCIDIDGGGGVWISTFIGSGAHPILRLYNGILNAYAPPYDANLDSSGSSGMVVYNPIANNLIGACSKGYFLSNGYAPPTPTVTTDLVYSEDDDDVYCSGIIVDPGDAPITETGFLYKNAIEEEWHTDTVPDFTYHLWLSGLPFGNQSYTIKAYAVNAFGASYSPETVINTQEPLNNPGYIYTPAYSTYYAIETGTPHGGGSPGTSIYGGQDGSVIWVKDKMYKTSCAFPGYDGMGRGDLTELPSWNGGSGAYVNRTPNLGCDVDKENNVRCVLSAAGYPDPDQTFGYGQIVHSTTPPLVMNFSYRTANAAGNCMENINPGYFPSAGMDTVKGILFIVSPGGWAVLGVGYPYFGNPIINPIWLAILKTVSVTDVAGGSALLTMHVLETELSIKRRGFCYATHPNPTLDDTVVCKDSNALGEWSVTVEGLSDKEHYYVRSYIVPDPPAGAILQNAVCYGSEIDFYTHPLPEVEIVDQKALTPTGATIDCDITYEGASAITARGVVVSLNPNPTLSDTVFTSEDEDDLFTAILSGLAPETQYHIRAYATNDEGTAYSADDLLNTLPDLGRMDIAIWNYLNEVRLTTGNTDKDVSRMVGFRKKTYSWATPDAAQDRMILDMACGSPWRYAVLLDGLESAAQTDASSPLAAGSYALKVALGTDDGQIRQAVEAHAGAVQEIALKYSVDSAGERFALSGGFIYRPDKTTPNVINKYSAEDYTFVKALQIASATNFTFRDILVMGGYLWVLYTIDDGNHYLYLAKIALSDFTAVIVTTHLNIATTEHGSPQITYWGAYSCRTAFCVTDGTYIYVASTTLDIADPPIGIAQYDVTVAELAHSITFQGPNTDRIREIDSLCYAGGYLYGVTSHSNDRTSYIFKALCSTLAVTNWLDTGAIQQYPSVCVCNGFLYDTCPSGGYTIEKRSITDLSLVSSWPIAAATAAAVGTDGAELYAHVTLAATKVVYKNVDVDGTTYTTHAQYQVVVTNTTLNLLLAGTLLYGDGFIIDLAPTVFTISLDGTQRLDFKLLVSAGGIPPRLRYAYVYIEKDGSGFYRVLQRDLSVVTNDTTGVVTEETWEADPYYNPATKHFYHRTTTISIRESDYRTVGDAVAANIDQVAYQGIGAEIDADMGRAYDATGIVKYLTGCTIGAKTFIGNVLIGSAIGTTYQYPNTVFVCAASGDAMMQVDIFAYDGTHTIDVEYGDGDEIVALAPMGESLFVGKKRSVVVLTPSGSTYERDRLTQAVGVCSQRSVVFFNDEVYWCDYNGIHSLSTREFKTINTEWIEDWKALTAAQKEGASCAIDRVNKLLIVNAAGMQWSYDLENGGWMQMELADVPKLMKVAMDGTIDLLMDGKLCTLNKSGATLHDGASYTMSWESNKIEPLKEAGGGNALDVLLIGWVIQYKTDVPITVSMFLDDAETAAATYTLPATENIKELYAPLGSMCKGSRIRFDAAATMANQKVKIESADVYYDPMVAGGDMDGRS